MAREGMIEVTGERHEGQLTPPFCRIELLVAGEEFDILAAAGLQ